MNKGQNSPYYGVFVGEKKKVDYDIITIGYLPKKYKSFEELFDEIKEEYGDRILIIEMQKIQIKN